MLKLKPKNIIYLILYALPNTILSFAIIYIINNVMAGNPMFTRTYMGIVFVAIIVYTYLLNIIFQKRLNLYAFNFLYENEKRVFGQILKASLIKLEKLGTQRFFTAVEDLRTFSFLPYTVTHTVNSVLMLVLCLVYMFTLSFSSALIVIVLIALVAACYFVVMNTMTKQVAILREYNEDYYQYVNDVMNGFKELKLSFFRRNSLMNNFLIPNRDKAMDLDFRINYVFLSINLISQYGLYFVVAVILFVLPQYGLLSSEDVIAYVVIILFISGPINNLINLQQMYTRFMVANTRVKKFIKDFEIVDDEKQDTAQEANTFNSLQFNDVVFSYPKNENLEEKTKPFALGPLNVSIKKGEVIFVVGGNGSGKSTFINALTGLYSISDGEIIVNDSISEKNNRTLQDMIAAVFTNNHIFSKNYDNFELENNKKYRKLVETMELDHIIADDKEASIRRQFSKGQSKRVSLILALLEEKPVLVLDEWAADQDPHFRKYFYEVLIPKLKAEGKTIIAVTHDDAYFNHADRVIKFDYGNIIKDVNIQANKSNLRDIWV
ncbi:ABC transporter ATP-binding/permease protein YojI [Kordia sp. SMS9]|uniref:ATP-binding cassette domain-containing protein n=1 Tax=Kordia sp. SMS9 TaxID=2282170 RepID=UPI000E0D27EE|nr:ATP-binding cassette domain-containing protein [Kordia sp. SMS9]AXG70738.1 ABC transporter ATP-binding/permease protein YojI [Kordia sp. SMS9]